MAVGEEEKEDGNGCSVFLVFCSLVVALFPSRLTTLETAFSERQDVINIMSRCEEWIKRTEEQVAARKPLTADVARVRLQVEEHKVTAKLHTHDHAHTPTKLELHVHIE